MTNQPTIIDRLTAAPASSRDVASVAEAVSRDLLLLLNSWEVLPTSDTPYSEAMQSSVLNYGVPNMSGRSAGPVNLQEYEKLVRDAVLRFEPRLKSEGLEVEVGPLPPPAGSAEFGLRIEGVLAGVDSSRRVTFRSRVSATTGRVALA